jgi:hypothetical protein
MDITEAKRLFELWLTKAGPTTVVLVVGDETITKREAQLAALLLNAIADRDGWVTAGQRLAGELDDARKEAESLRAENAALRGDRLRYHAERFARATD